jgi:glutathione synthase/RimK-type ligase-like ATP-grasp enzyme
MFPSLIQEYIEKEYEVRVFYLDGVCYSMAIFSQNDTQTSVDFRQYNRKKPNRNVPYHLPVSLQEKVEKIMTSLRLNTGSLDFIRSVNGEYFFLEINPAGQYGMMSQRCNYNLEKKVAEWLCKE